MNESLICNIGTCICESGYTGALCDTPVCPLGCANGNCILPGLCQCYDGWSGSSCNVAVCRVSGSFDCVYMHVLRVCADVRSCAKLRIRCICGLCVDGYGTLNRRAARRHMAAVPIRLATARATQMHLVHCTVAHTALYQCVRLDASVEHA